MEVNENSGKKDKRIAAGRGLYGMLACRASSVLVLGALAVNLLAKLYYVLTTGFVGRYFDFIFSDIVVLGSVEFVLALVFFLRPRRSVARISLLIAGVVCTWSVVNISWVIATKMQILPAVIAPVVRDAVTRLAIVGHRLYLEPGYAAAILIPSAVALAFFFRVLIHPRFVRPSGKALVSRGIVYATLAFVVGIGGKGSGENVTLKMLFNDMRYNCQLKAITSLVSGGRTTRTDYLAAKRTIPLYDEIDIPLKEGKKAPNIIFIVFEGMAYKQTSLYDKLLNLTPYLSKIAEDGVLFANCRPPITHSSKSLFGALTGRIPSISPGYMEAIPVEKPYMSIATIMERSCGFRTAFFQSAKGTFEARCGLVHNLGYDKFWAREDMQDANAFLGYLASDEFAMLKPITEWIDGDTRPFLLTVFLSATHDPYHVPSWYGENVGQPLARYQRTLRFTDDFLKAFDGELAKRGLVDNTVLCLIGDHGEAFGEHHWLAHDRIPFDEVLQVVWVLRAGGLVGGGKVERNPTCTIDVVPTILGLMGFDVSAGKFDGVDALSTALEGRKVYFSGWMNGGPAGYVIGSEKFFYDPISKVAAVYDLEDDCFELKGREIAGRAAEEMIADVTGWRKGQMIATNGMKSSGAMCLYDKWFCRWKNRVPRAELLEHSGGSR